MKAGNLVKHTLSDDARGVILAAGTNYKGVPFFVVDWLTKEGAVAKRNTPDELILVEVPNNE
tara:strand:- start:599 stop:784 length:186 start_codon:yes stop_codon:yes gene_type:complete